MKRFLLLFMVAGFALSTASCKKCANCIVRNADGEVLKVLPETCGKQEDVDNYKSGCEASYTPTGGICDCAPN